jgi:hypothetical protein
VKQSLPWPLKFALKLVFGASHVSYRVLKRAHLVEHGRMEDASFARRVFENHVLAPTRERNVRPAGTLLELGPGDSVATGVLGRAAGFATVELVDAGPFADLQPAAIARLFASLGAEPLALSPDAAPVVVLESLRKAGIDYRTEGLKSLRSIATGSVGHSFSNTVMQHVYRSEVPEMLRELGRVHAAGSLGSHSVNYSDHFSGGFVNHQLPAWFMESALVKRANLYTNRLHPLEYLELFRLAAFDPLRVTVDFDSDSRQRMTCGTLTELQQTLASHGRPYRTHFLVQKL